MSEEYNSRIEKKKQAKEARKNSSNDKGPKKGFWKKFLFFCLTAGCVMFLVAVGAFWWIVKDAPDLDETLLKSPESSVLLANDGETVIAEVGAESRDNVTLDQIPETLIEAVLATEDVNFYDHFGIDIKRTISAVWSTVFGGNTQGGSTITQQLVKNAFLTTDQTVTRKVQEWYLSIQLERRFSKDEILEMYFNKNLYGGNIYGVAKAAERFFGLGADELDQLTLEQSALLAGVPQSPNNFNPTVEDNLERAEKRRNTVLKLMNRHGYISDETMEETQSVAIKDTLNIQSSPNGQFQAFIDVAITEAQEKTDANIFEDGLTITTTLDPDIQKITEDVISTNDYISYPDNENLETGVVILDTQTGAIQAIGGGRNYQAGGYNYATMIKRQPGSTAKPLLSYGPAINKLKWSTAHLLVDEEWSYSSGQVVRNSGRSYTGEQTIRYHLTQSTNVPALKTYQEVGTDYAVDFARDLGLPIDDEDASNESNPLGTMSTASPLIMAGAYASFGNGGYYTEPYTVSKIVFSDGTEENVTPEKEQVMEDYTAYMITDMLRNVVQSGTGTRANISGIDVAGKSGTTSYNDAAISKYGLPSTGAAKDAWFVGYTPQYTGAVWTGYSKTNSSEDYLNTERSRFSQQVFKEIMSRVATSTERFKQPNSVKNINGELYVVGSEDENTAKTSLKAVTNLQAKYDADSDSIQLSWDHSSNISSDVSFKVSYTVDGTTTALTPTSEMSAALQNPEIGKTYNFTIIAVSGDITSEPASISVTVPDKATEEEETPDEDDTTDEGNTPDDGDTTDEGDGTDEGDSTGGGDNPGEVENPDDGTDPSEGNPPVDDNDPGDDNSSDDEPTGENDNPADDRTITGEE